MTKNKLHFFVLTACLIGYCWLFFTLNHKEQTHFSICFIKNATSIPCPSCGTTRAITELLKVNIKESLLLNPFGVIVASIMFISPIWIVVDLLLKKDSFYQFYKKVERFIRRKHIAVILIALVFFNWYWNIKKGL